eukprot:TRINITY_DN35805_c0_g1_i1.p1 TRINITY_DN35805_c0_g1~~TRINITY_DN35805_c0_g1_i1.p1  ORF type:complete len:223 (-),score=30.89 TRINITY_DN35805_c0_g1_i1:199-867(-)
MPLWRIATAPDDIDGADPLPTMSPSTSISNIASESPGGPQISSSDSHSYRSSSPRANDASFYASSPFLVTAKLPPDTNKNTEWFLYPGVWSMYVFFVVAAWLLILSILGCSAGTAWTLVSILHFVVTFYLFHWKKGSPFSEDQGLYDKLTWWEQLDQSRQLTKNRKFLTCVPFVLYLIASYTARNLEYSEPMLAINTVVVFTLIIAKLPLLHQVRLFGINAG